MAESLLSFSEVLLFGRPLSDLQINAADADDEESVRAATDASLDLTNNVSEVDGIDLALNDKVLVRLNGSKENGIYQAAAAQGQGFQLGSRQTLEKGKRVAVSEGEELGGTTWVQRKEPDKQIFKEFKPRRGRGKNNFLKGQFGPDAKLARIYGFSYEGTYFELPEPAIFLVHGDGESATGKLPDKTEVQVSRAPLNPSVTGVASAEYQFANDIMVWDYDKADYSIRFDVMTGMLEQILLDVYFGGGSDISGAKVSGAKVSGAKVSGAKVSGAKVSGAKVSGAKARGSGD